MARRPTLTAAVLNYNGRALLEVVLPSLAAQEYDDFESVVVDNGSSDDSLEYLRSEWPDVRVVALPENRGVTVALNACVEAGHGSEFVCLLNNDLELDPRCLGELVAAMRAHPEAASGGAKLLDFAERDVIDGAGDIFVWQGLPIRRGWGERDRGQYDEPQAIFGACGATAIYRSAAFASVGSFDEAYFAGYEDADWAFRAQLAGWDCRYVPSAVSYHMGSATLGGADASDNTQRRLWRNGVWLVAKNYPAAAFVREAPRLIHGQLMSVVRAARQRRLGLWMRAMREAADGLAATLARRKLVQASAVKTKRELDSRIGFDR